MSVHPIEELPFPFGDSDTTLSDSDLRQTAYEVLVGACRSGVVRPLTFTSVTSAPALERSLTSSAARKVKRVLGMKKKNKRGGDLGSVKRGVTSGELIRVQMRVSEQVDSRVRRALLRIAAGQLGRRMESIVLPLELLHQFKITDFPNKQEFENWQIRNLKVLEVGLLSHPLIPLDRKDNNAPQILREIIHKAIENPLEMRRDYELTQSLRNAAMSLALRSADGPETCHWADGPPFNLILYRQLLEACFDVNDETSVIEEVDEVLELIKKTWTILGMSQALHNVSFSWVLLHRYVSTGQVENDLLFASSNLLMEEVEEGYKFSEDPVYAKALSSMLGSMLGWAEKRLLAYRDSFNTDNTETMQSIVSLAVAAATKMEGVDLGRERVDAYIRSSLQIAFAQKAKKASSRLAILARDIHDLAIDEKTVFSPILKKWQPLAAGVAAATLHASYAKELRSFVSSVTEPTPDAIRVLRAADALEKSLVEIAVEDSVDSEDGGKAVINRMPPYEAEAAIARLVDSWIRTRVEMLNEWLDRNLQIEVWDPRANKERLAPSGIEVLRILDETLEAFFGLPIPMHAILLPSLMIGLDKCLQNYITKAKSGCGSRSSFIPAMPPLTRCSTGSRFGSLFSKKQRPNHTVQIKKPHHSNGTEKSNGVPQLCVRINTLHHIRSQLQALENRTLSHLRSSDSTTPEDIARCNPKKLELAASSCSEAIRSLSEAAAYNVVFHKLSHVFSDALYVGEPSSSRIEPFLVELEQYLEVIASTVHDRVRTRVISDVMRASFEGFLLVLLAGGPSRGFARRDSILLDEDFRFLSDLFWSGGDGLPADMIGKCAMTAKSVIPLFGEETEGLIQRFMERNGSPAEGRRVPLPETSERWSPGEPNTILRVLCYRNDEVAAKFLKKTYNFPTKL